MLSSGCGARIRRTAAQAIAPAAPRMRAPSAPLEKYSAFPYPNACSSSGGREASDTMARVSSAAARFTSDSSASERSPTEPVRRNAMVFSPIVATAAPTDSQANRTREAPCAMRDP
jgi:hypothetical protein